MEQSSGMKTIFQKSKKTGGLWQVSLGQFLKDFSDLRLERLVVFSTPLIVVLMFSNFLWYLCTFYCTILQPFQTEFDVAQVRQSDRQGIQIEREKYNTATPSTIFSTKKTSI